MTIKTWTDASVLRIAPPADHAASEFTSWHPTIKRFGIRFRRARDGAWGSGTYTVVYHQSGSDHPVSIGKVGGVTLDVAIAEAQKIFGDVAKQRLTRRIERKAAKAAHAEDLKAHVDDYNEHMTARGFATKHIGATRRRYPRDFSDLQERPKILTFEELRAYGVLYTRQHIDRMEKAGKFPKRVPLGTYRVGWLESEVINHMRTLVAQRSRQLGELGSAGQIKRLGGNPRFIRPMRRCRSRPNRLPTIRKGLPRPPPSSPDRTSESSMLSSLSQTLPPRG